MRLINTGFPRSATMGIVQLFARNGVLACHEPFRYVDDIGQWLGSITGKTYSLDDVPNSVREYVSLFPYVHNGTDTSWFYSGWSIGLAMYELSRAHPDIEWLFVLRRPEDSINSLRNYRNGHDIHVLLDRWMQYHTHAIRQMERMGHRPRVLEFNRLVAGEYDEELLGKFGVEKTKDVWGTKHNSHGEYGIHDLGAMGQVCNAMCDVIRGLCEGLG